MNIKSLYPRDEEDKIFQKVEEYIYKTYPLAKIRRIQLGEIIIIVQLQYSQIHLQRGEFDESYSKNIVENTKRKKSKKN